MGALAAAAVGLAGAVPTAGAAPVTVSPKEATVSLSSGRLGMSVSCKDSDCRLKASVSYRDGSGRQVRLSPVARAAVCGGRDQVRNGTWPSFACTGVPIKAGAVTALHIRLSKKDQLLRRAVTRGKVSVRVQFTAVPTVENWQEVGSRRYGSFPAPEAILGPWQPAGEFTVRLKR